MSNTYAFITYNNYLFFETIVSLGFHNITLFVSSIFFWVLLQGSIIWLLYCQLLLIWSYSVSRLSICLWILNLYFSLDFSALRLVYPEWHLFNLGVCQASYVTYPNLNSLPICFFQSSPFNKREILAFQYLQTKIWVIFDLTFSQTL